MDAFTTLSIFCSVLSLWFLYRRYFKKKQFVPSGCVVFISGCDTGIGFQLALYFASAGCRVIAGCLRKPEISVFPSSVRIVSLDITSEVSVKKAIEDMRHTLEEWNADLWCLINNAGVCVVGEFEWLTSEQCGRMININLLGTMRLTKACLPLVRKSKGRIVTISSVNGMISYPGLSVYCATKFGLEAFCDAIRIELKPHGVDVVLIQPGDLAKLTSIMANHAHDAEIMWKEMSSEARDFYSSYFDSYHKAAMKNQGLTSPLKFEDSPLMENIMQAVLGKSKPQDRYFSVPFSQKFMYKILFMLPVRLKDVIFVYITQKIFQKSQLNT